MDYNSVYDIRLKMLEVMGGDVTKQYDSVYSIDLAILRLLEEYCGSGGGGGEKTYDYLTFTALELSKITYQPSDTTTAQYSYDKVNWETADNVQLSLNKGDKVYFKGEITGEQGGFMSALFRMSGKIEASGSIMSLQAGDPNDKTIKYNYEFSGLFNYCSSLTTAPELPATTLANGCYNGLFSNCTSLTTVPELPATTLTDGCYENLFYNCTSLITAPELPATTLGYRCYYSMFQDCTSLTTAPDLPATTLANNCYSSMFNGCSSLTTVPTILPATTLADSCYSGMFSRCSSLTTAPELPATTLADDCYDSMFQNCTSLTTAPVLPATTLVTNCYTTMFTGCSSLNYIKALFTTEPSSSYTDVWVYKVPSTGTFVKSKDATWDVTGNNGIPTGWTVETA